MENQTTPYVMPLSFWRLAQWGISEHPPQANQYTILKAFGIEAW
jgi:hypothetical protein